MSNLYAHQKRILDEDKQKCGLFLSTGSGKTRLALTLAEGKILIIMPKTQKLDQNWERELKKMDSKKTITTISKETFRRDWQSIPYHDTLILDEADTMLGVTTSIKYVKKQPVIKTSQIFESIKAWNLQHKPRRVYLVTATPTRTPMTVWGASEILGMGWDWYKFRDDFYIRKAMERFDIWVLRKDVATKNKLAQLVQAIGFTGQLSEYFDVPEQTYKTDYIEITPKQKKVLDMLGVQFPDPMVLMGKKLQVENGVLTGNQYEAGQRFENGKIEKILDYALQFPKMVIYAKYTEQIHAIYDALNNEGYNVKLLTGATDDRETLFAEANAMSECILVCQSSISAGYELPTFPVMLFASMTYSIVDRIQAEGRILRANALKKNLYITLVTKPYPTILRIEGKDVKVNISVDNAVNKSILEKKDFSERIYVEQLGVDKVE